MIIKEFILFELICVIIQILSFIPVYFLWKSDCKSIGENNLGMSLKDRFVLYLIAFPIWSVPIFVFLKD